MKYTHKQTILIELVLRGNADGSFLDIDQLLDTLPYETSKESLHFSLRALIKHGLVEKRERETRRGRKRCILAPTGLAYLTLGHPLPQLPSVREKPALPEVNVN